MKYQNRLAQLAIVILSSLGCTTLLAGNGQPLDRIVAVVNNSVIVESELDLAIAKTKKQIIAMHTSLPIADVLRKQVLDQLINKKIELDLADQLDIKADEEDIDKAISSIAHNNHISLEQLYQIVAKQGMSKADYRKDIADEYLIHQLQQKAIGPKISLSEQDVDDFMRSAAWQSHHSKEYHLEDILIALPEAPSSKDVSAARKRAENIVAKLHQGVSFKDAANAESSDNKVQAGDLGWRKLPEIPSAFADQLVQKKEQEVMGPIQTANGFHIIHIADIRSVAMQGNPAEQRHQVQQLIYERKYDEALQSWLTKIRSEAFIDTHVAV